eukprot:7379197-Prymnesium_polylepis.2
MPLIVERQVHGNDACAAAEESVEQAVARAYSRCDGSRLSFLCRLNCNLYAELPSVKTMTKTISLHSGGTVRGLFRACSWRAAIPINGRVSTECVSERSRGRRWGLGWGRAPWLNAGRLAVHACSRPLSRVPSVSRNVFTPTNLTSPYKMFDEADRRPHPRRPCARLWRRQRR